MAESDWKYLQYNVENGQKRTSDGPSGGASSLSDLDDTNISNPSDGQMLGYDGTEGKWKNVAAPAGSVTDVTLDGNTVVNGQGVAVLTTPNVNDLKDTSISSPSSGQTLQYNATNQKWENVTPASGGNVDDVKVNGVSVVNEDKEAEIVSYKEVTQSEYEALLDTKLTDGIAYFIKDATEAEGFPPLIYSMSEREVGVWADGKPLYQKSISLAGISIATGQYAIVYTQANIELKYANGCFIEGNYVYTVPEPFLRIRQDGNNIVFRAMEPSAWDISGGFLTIRYTKTTDTAGQGIWAGNGAMAHHYSTDEVIVGTWIDGKPLYEKVVQANCSFTTRFNGDIYAGDIDLSSYLSSDIDKAFVITDKSYYMPSSTQKRTFYFAQHEKDNGYGKFYCHVMYSRQNVDCVFVIQYTKTTD